MVGSGPADATARAVALELSSGVEVEHLAHVGAASR